MRNVPLRLFILISLAAGVAWSQRATGEYAIVLKESPLAAGVKSPERRAAVARSQQQVRGAIAAAGIRQTGSANLLVNAIFVQATPDQAKSIGNVDGVRFVQYLPPVKRALNRALDLVQARAAWSQVGGEQNAGSGVKIAVIDSGIDHTHAAFQDASLAVPGGFPKGESAYTNNKVIVARSYVAQLPFAEIRAEDSRPDDTTPRDRVGHGTALAMIAAGRQTQAPLGVITGVAPKAYLGNYKVFGSPGVNDSTRASVMILALQDAVNDGMDIAVLSVASPAQFGPLVRDSSCQSSVPLGLNIPQDACDVRAYAIENAVRSGLAVVVPGGNRGLEFGFPALASVTTPGTAPSAITVGATTNSHVLYSTVRAEGNAQLQDVDTFFGNGPKPAAALRAPLREVTTFACETLAANSLAGTIALIPRGDCAYAAKVNNAQRAGAVGVIIYQPDGVNGLIYMQALATTGIPAVLVRNRDGLALRDWIRANPSGTVVIDPALREEDAEFDTVADFNSHGPAIGDVTLGEGPIKPELAAVGTDLYVATQRLDPNGELWDPSGYTTVQGTSFAAAMAAGAAALVKQRNPGFTPAQIKSALVNTASTGVRDSLGEARVVAVGAGKLHVDNAVRSNVTVDPPVLSFGVVNAAAAFPKTITLRVTNTASTAQNLSFEIARRDADSRAQLTVTPSSANLNPGASTEVSVRLAGTRPNAGQYEGVVRIRGGAVELRVPYLRCSHRWYCCGSRCAAGAPG